MRLDGESHSVEWRELWGARGAAAASPDCLRSAGSRLEQAGGYRASTNKMSSNHTVVNSTVCVDHIHGDVEIIAAVLYLPFTIWGVLLGVYILRVRSALVESLTLLLVTLTCLVGSMLIRSIWFVVHCFTNATVDRSSGWIESILGTVAMLLFFSAFSVYVFSWARSMNKLREVCLRNVTIYGNVGIYALVICLSIYFALTYRGDYLIEGGMAADAIQIIIAVCDLLLSVAFIGYGACALKLIQKVRENTRTKASGQMGWRMWTAICICAGCFFFKTILLIVRSAEVDIGGSEGALYPWFDYLLPELAPAIMIMGLFQQNVWRPKRRIARISYDHEIVSQYTETEDGEDPDLTTDYDYESLSSRSSFKSAN